LFRIKGYRRAGIPGIPGIPGAGQGIPTKKIPDHLFGLGELVFQQVLDGLLVHLGQPQTVGKFEQVLGELTGSRPDFKQVGVVAPAREGQRDLFGKSHIGQKMLTQLLFGANAVHGPAKIG